MDKKIKEQELVSRRSFLKKAAYVAPTIIALGSMTIPTSAAASNTVNRDTSSEVTGPQTNPTTDDRGGARRIF